MHEKLKECVCQANIELQKQQLVIYSWGNVSGIDREDNIIAIKPSGVSYEELTPDKIVLLDLEGNIVEGDLKPSSDTPTHLELYRNFKNIGGICHTHSSIPVGWQNVDGNVTQGVYLSRKQASGRTMSATASVNSL